MLGLQLSPFLDLIGVVPQMGAHDALYEARKISASISQSTDNEVGTLLSCPTQIDGPTFDQLQEIFIEVRRSKTPVREISVGVRRSKTLVGEISVGVRRLKVPALGFIANLTRLSCASATVFGIVDPQVLFDIHLEARVAFILQRRAIHRVGRQLSDRRDAFTFQVRRDRVPPDGR